MRPTTAAGAVLAAAGLTGVATLPAGAPALGAFLWLTAGAVLLITAALDRIGEPR